MGLKEALKAWEEKTSEPPENAKTIKLCMCQPFLSKLDPQPLQSLKSIEHLSLSTNTIDKLCFPALPSLRILSIGRNALKSLAGLEPLVNLEELWCSYNQLEKLTGVEGLVKLRVVRAGNNKIGGWDGLKALSSLPLLEDLTLLGNPLEESYASKQSWRDELATKFPSLKKIEGKMVFRDDSGRPVHGKEEVEVPVPAPAQQQQVVASVPVPVVNVEEAKRSQTGTPSKGRAGTASKDKKKK